MGGAYGCRTLRGPCEPAGRGPLLDTVQPPAIRILADVTRRGTRLARLITALWFVASCSITVGSQQDGPSESDDVIAIDLREPRTGSDFGSRTDSVAEFEGPARFVVHLPDRRIEGEYDDVVLLELTATPPKPFDAVSLKNTADDAAEVEALFARVRNEFPVDGERLEALNAFEADFVATVDARGGRIDIDDFEKAGGSAIHDLGLWDALGSAGSLKWRVFTDGTVLFSIDVVFGYGT